LAVLLHDGGRPTVAAHHAVAVVGAASFPLHVLLCLAGHGEVAEAAAAAALLLLVALVALTVAVARLLLMLRLPVPATIQL
jgi:hypothetical protein